MSHKSRTDLVEVLQKTLGPDVASSHVGRIADRLGLGQQIDVNDALQVLETLASEPGVVGVAARFAKARVHLNWS